MGAGLTLAAAGFAMLHGMGDATGYLAMLPAQLAIRFGIGLAVPPMTAALLSTVPRSRSGSASGLLNAIRQAGAAIGVALFGALMRGDMVGGLRVAVVIAAGLLGVAATASVFGLRAQDRAPAPGQATARMGAR